MLNEIISFGGCWKDFRAIVRSKYHHNEKEKKVRLKQASDEKTILVQIKVKQRDTNEKVDELNEATGKPTGRKIDNPRYGKFYYESVDSFEVEQATTAEVKEAVLRGLTAASKK